jgi:hypothetical protein
MRKFTCPNSDVLCDDARCTQRHCVMNLDDADRASTRDEVRNESELRLMIKLLAQAGCREKGMPEPTYELLEKLYKNPKTRRSAELLKFAGISEIAKWLQN